MNIGGSRMKGGHSGGGREGAVERVNAATGTACKSVSTSSLSLTACTVKSKQKDTAKVHNDKRV